MNARIFLITLVFVALIGCKSKSAFNYSEDIIKKERSLVPYIDETEDKVSKYATSGQFDSVVIAASSMENRIEEKIGEIKAMPVPDAKEADNFRSAILKYFDYIKSLYTGYKNWGNAPTEEKRDEIALEVQKLVSNKDKVIREMQAAQRKYADANGFKVEK